MCLDQSQHAARQRVKGRGCREPAAMACPRLQEEWTHQEPQCIPTSTSPAVCSHQQDKGPEQCHVVPGAASSLTGHVVTGIIRFWQCHLIQCLLPRGNNAIPLSSAEFGPQHRISCGRCKQYLSQPAHARTSNHFACTEHCNEQIQSLTPMQLQTLRDLHSWK